MAKNVIAKQAQQDTVAIGTDKNQTAKSNLPKRDGLMATRTHTAAVSDHDTPNIVRKNDESKQVTDNTNNKTKGVNGTKFDDSSNFDKDVVLKKMFKEYFLSLFDFSKMDQAFFMKNIFETRFLSDDHLLKILASFVYKNHETIESYVQNYKEISNDRVIYKTTKFECAPW